MFNMSLIIKIINKIIYLYYRGLIKQAEKKSGCRINFVPQGAGGVRIDHAENFEISHTSHLKSNTYIECSGRGENRSIFSYWPRVDYILEQS